ncbi:MAG: branched-chain amino acid aminotransferase [Myxococcota bacterium]|nr:branched-chain amino acid aminotransferase [Myxococcota bacterium]
MDRVILDWPNLGFHVRETDINVRCHYQGGEWGPLEFSDNHNLTIPMAATALHYGQSIFEGLKAFETVDGRVAIFRPDENAARMQYGARKLLMEAPPTSLFLEAVSELVRQNRRFVPPAGSGAALYLRPLLFGTSPLLGVRPAKEFTFCMFATPVGPYFRSVLSPIRLRVERESHRAAPLGIGDVKAAGNYAASMRSVGAAKHAGFDNVLYLDARESRYIDETGATNFFGIQSGDQHRYITPRSNSILASITNKSLMTIADDLGYLVEHRPIAVDELSSFDEAGACGTAAVITPIQEIVDSSGTYGYVAPGPVTRKLYDRLTGIQAGVMEDTHGWVHYVD